jgi:hypothetical protein
MIMKPRRGMVRKLLLQMEAKVNIDNHLKQKEHEVAIIMAKDLLCSMKQVYRTSDRLV